MKIDFEKLCTSKWNTYDNELIIKNFDQLVFFIDIYNSNGGVYVSDYIHEKGLNPSKMSRLISSMSKRGIKGDDELINSQMSKNDDRSTLLTLSFCGEQLINECFGE